MIFARHHKSRRGQAAIFGTMSLMMIMGLLGMVVDIGWAYWRKEACKTAAESAAIAAIMAVQNASSFSTCGSNGITCQSETACSATPTSPPANNIDNACLYAKQNGFVNTGKQKVKIEANITAAPTTGYAPTYWVRATVSETIPQLFSAAIGQPNATVSSRAVAGAYQQPTGACIWSLDPNGSGAVGGSGTWDVESSCGLYINSNSGSALDVGGNATINASVIKINGNYTTHGGPTINPTPLVAQGPVTDPLAGLSAPPYPSGHCDSASGIPTDGSLTAANFPSNGYYVVCSGGFSMSGNPNVTLPAGIYVLKAGSIDLHNGTLNGTGVTFYMTGTFSSITINGNVDINLSAPTSGPTRGIVMWADRAFSNGDVSVTINGGSNTLLNGTLYFPTTSLTYSGGANTTSTYTALVCWDASFKGNSYFAADPNGVHTAIGLPKFTFIAP